MAVSAIAGLAYAVGAAAAGATVFGLSATTFGGFMTAFALGASLSAISRALMPKPKLGNQLQGITKTSREPASSRKLVYGKMRVGGQCVFIGNSGSNNEYLHLVIVFASHEIESYEEFWFNDNKVYENNAVHADWTDVVTVAKFDGTQTAADSTLVSEISEWTDDHILNGMAYVHFRLEWDQDLFPQGVPNISALIKGKKVYDPRDTNQSSTDSSTWTFSQNAALCLRDYLVDKKYGLGEDPALIDDDAFEATADLCDEQVGVGNGVSASAIVSGTVYEITEVGTTDFTAIGASSNTVGVLFTATGAGSGTGRATSTLIDRYQLNGLLDTGNQIKDNIEQMLTAMGGSLSYSGGKYYITGAGYASPTVTFDESDVVSEIQLQTKQSRRGVYNGVKGIFVDEDSNYKVLEYPAQLNSSYETEDGDPIYLDMPLPFVTSHLQAQRIAKVALLKSRQQVIINMTVNLKGLRVKVGDTINVSNTHLGYSSKVFEVIGYSLVISDAGLAVNLTCTETAEAVFSWYTSDEQDFLSGGTLDLYDGRTVDNVTSLSHTVIGLKGPDGKTLTNVDFTWTAPNDAFIEYYLVTIEKDDDGNVYEYQTREPRLRVPNLDIGSAYEVIVKAQNLIGVRSSGTTLNIASLAGDTTAPAVPTNGTAVGGLRQITVTWTEPTDDDFAIVWVYYSDQDDIATATKSKTRSEEFIYTLANDETGAVTKYFWLTSQDYSGNESAATASFTGTSKQAIDTDIGDNQVKNAQIGAGAVDTPELADGAIGGTTVTATSIYHGAGNFNNSDTGFYLDSGGDFSLKDKLSFDSSDSELIVRGEINADVLNVVDANVLGVLTAGSVQPASITNDSIDASVFDEILSRGGLIGGIFESVSDVTYDGSTTATATTSTVNHDGSSQIEVQFTAIQSWSSTTDVSGTALNLSQSFAYTPSGGNSTAIGSATTLSATRTRVESDGLTVYEFIQKRRVKIAGSTIPAGNLTFSCTLQDLVSGQSCFELLSGGLSFVFEVYQRPKNMNLSGDLTVGGDLTVNGTTTTINTATLDVEDKNITLNYGTGDTSASADGAGITIQDAVDASNNATILWDATNDEFDFSHDINVTGGITSSGDVTANKLVAKHSAVLRAYRSSWSYPTHDIIYSGWTSGTGDYVTLKAAGNSNGPHGVIVAADQGIYFGRTNAETGAVVADNQTTPLDTNWAHVDANGLDVRVGTISYSGTTVIDSSRNATFAGLTVDGNVGIGTTDPDKMLVVKGNNAEIVIDDTDTTDTPRLRFRESGITSGTISTDASNLIFSAGTSEDARINTSGDLLVGTTVDPTGLASTTTATGFGTGTNGLSVIVRDGGVPLYVNRLTSDGDAFVIRQDGSTKGSLGINNDDLYIGTGDTTLRFVDGSDAIIPRGTAGAYRDAAIDFGLYNNRFKNMYLSGGVYLGGSGSANLLDDYEEGTWTPVVSDAATGGNTATCTTQLGRYRKVGNMITVSVKLVDIDRTGMTTGNAIYIQGLPFTAGAGDLGQQQGALFCNQINLDTNCRSMCVHTSSSKSYLLVREIRDNTSSVVTNVGKITTAGTADIFATITYFN